jgi:PAS domain S-box-containing protein
MHALDGRVLIWNKGAEKITGYSAQEMIGGNVTEISPPDSAQAERILAEMDRILESVKRGESLHHFQVKHIRKDGRLIWISIDASPIRDSRGEVVAVSSTARDITEIKVLEEQLRQAAKLERSRSSGRWNRPRF